MIQCVSGSVIGFGSYNYLMKRMSSAASEFQKYFGIAGNIDIQRNRIRFVKIGTCNWGHHGSDWSRYYDLLTLKPFRHYWNFVTYWPYIHWSPMVSPHKGQEIRKTSLPVCPCYSTNVSWILSMKAYLYFILLSSPNRKYWSIVILYD